MEGVDRVNRQEKESRFIAEALESLCSLVCNGAKNHLLPDKHRIHQFVDQLHNLLFPSSSEFICNCSQAVRDQFQVVDELLDALLTATYFTADDRLSIRHQFFLDLQDVLKVLRLDIAALLETDPAAQSETEIIACYPGFRAVAFFRYAHVLYKANVQIIPRIITEYAHALTGIDIHPGASIGHSFAIDHGTGVVIGETTVIGNYVSLYQGVTLGSLSVSKDDKSKKRHPTIEDKVKIYANATVLGGATVIGYDSIIGGNSWVTHSVEPFSKIYHTAAEIIKKS
jgi:serine O-acetyltransferase